MKKFFGHLKTILIHKWWVFYYCCKLDIPWRGLVHDLSKFSPVEFWEGVKYYQGNSSPINAAKKEQGYSLAWQHHKGRNPHHYEYWIDNLDSGGKPIKMPYKYMLELIADYLAAGKTYNGKDFTFMQEFEWWDSVKLGKKMHLGTETTIDIILHDLATSTNVNKTFKLYRKDKKESEYYYNRFLNH